VSDRAGSTRLATRPRPTKEGPGRIRWARSSFGPIGLFGPREFSFVVGRVVGDRSLVRAGHQRRADHESGRARSQATGIFHTTAIRAATDVRVVSWVRADPRRRPGSRCCRRDHGPTWRSPPRGPDGGRSPGPSSRCSIARWSGPDQVVHGEQVPVERAHSIRSCFLVVVGDEPNPLAWFQDQCHESSLSAAAAFRRQPAPSMAEAPESGSPVCFVGWLSGRSRRGASTLRKRAGRAPAQTAVHRPDQHVGVEVEVARPGQRPCLDPDLAKAAIPKSGDVPAPDQGAGPQASCGGV